MKQGKIVDAHGTIRYFKDDYLHTDNDLPAVEWADGDKFWYQNGCLHRLAGPTIIYFNGEESYYINDERLTKEQHANHPEVKKYKLQQILNRIIKE